jgi:hypothetical protein
MKQNELDHDPEFTSTIGLGGNCQITGRQTKYNLENGEEYVELTKTPYQKSDVG